MLAGALKVHNKMSHTGEHVMTHTYTLCFSLHFLLSGASGQADRLTSGDS